MKYKVGVQSKFQRASQRLFQSTLLPFYILLGLYSLQGEQETPLAILAKVAPIWYLVFYIQIVRPRTLPLGRSALKGDDSYRHFFTAGLVLSSLGDMLMVFKDTLLIPAIAIFGLAHLTFTYGLRRRSTHKRYAWLVLPIAVGMFFIMLAIVESPSLMVTVFFYNIVIMTMFFYAVSCAESNQDGVAGMFGAVGALTFVLSDFIIGLNLFLLPIPYAQLVIMSTYYFAQLSLTLSTY